jgi:dihydroflavonol-4-reductase
MSSCNVRDVADLHLRAMAQADAKGERFLAVAGNCVSLLDVARILKRELGNAAGRAPGAEAPDWLVRLLALWNRGARRVLPNLGKIRNATSTKAQRVLGWSPRPSEEAIVATAESLIRLHLVKSLRG